MPEQDLSMEEMGVFFDNGDEINEHLKRIFFAFEAGDEAKAGERLADFSIFCFKMGKENHNA